MRNVVMIGMLVLGIGCGSEDAGPVVTNCLCQAVCLDDNSSVDYEATYCADDVDMAADVESQSCLTVLNEAGCVQASCACQCEATDQGCE